jgi:hypothetical protein
MKSMLMRGLVGCWAACGLALAVSGGAAADGIKPGLWRVINKPEINGTAGQPRQNMRCLTAAEVADLDKTFSPVSRTVNSECERVEHEFTPKRLKWRLQCKGQIDMDVAGEFNFDADDHYTGLVTARSSMAGQPMQDVRTQIEGQWTGECP